MLQSWFGRTRKKDRPGVDRSTEIQSKIDIETRKLSLYHYDACWFCKTVRRTIERLKLDIESRDIHRDPGHRRRLLTEGGSGTVPCLHIEHDDGRGEWLYESRDICCYLEGRFGGDDAV